MALITVFEPILLILICILIFTQVVLPPFIGKRYFWIFRKSEKKIIEKEETLADLSDEERAEDIEERIIKKRREVQDKKTKLLE